MSEQLGQLQDQTFARPTAATATSYPPERRLGANSWRHTSTGAKFAVVATTRANDRPSAAMAVYRRRGTTFWLPTMAGSIRTKNLQPAPWLTIVIAEADHPMHIAVIVEGPAEVVPPTDVPTDVQASMTGSWVSAWIRLEAERLLSYADEDSTIALRVASIPREIAGGRTHPITAVMCTRNGAVGSDVCSRASVPIRRTASSLV